MLLSNLELLATAPGGVAKLRELILTLAVQGKLVPQDPADEPASVLLQKIRAEKDRLIAEGKIKRDKPLAEIAEEEKPFELPQGWEWVRLQQIGYTQTGTTPDKKNPEFYGTHIPFIKPGDIYPGYVDYDNEALSERGVQDSGRIAPAGSILMVCIGTIGKTNRIDRDCSFNQQINSITPLVCSPDFVSLYLRCPEFQSQAWARSASTTISILNKGNWEQIPVALPPLAEQSRIVTRVEALMRLCDALEAKGQLEATQHAQLVSTLLGTLTASTTPEELADNWQRVAQHFDLLLDRPEAIDALEQTLLQLAVRGLLVPQDPTDEPASVLLQKIRTEKDRLIAAGQIKRDKPLPPITDEEKPFELPMGWEWARLGALANFIDYRGKTPEKTTSGVPLITAKNVRRGFLNREPREFIAESAYDGWMTRGFPRVGDLLFTTEAPLGNVAAINIEERFALAQRVICFGLYESQMSGLLLTFLQSPWMQEVFAGQATGVTAQGIKSSRLQLILVPVPPQHEQARIVTRVTALRRLCADLRQRLAESQSVQARLAEALVVSVA